MRGLKLKGEKNLRPVWVKIFGLLLLLAGSVAAQLNPEFRVNTYTTNSQSSPAVAMDTGGNFVVVWSSNGQDGSGYGIYAQRFAADGSPLGGEFRVNTYTSNDQAYPAVAMDAAGNFVVVWQSLYQDGSEYGIYAQRYAADGSPLGSEFRVNTDSTDSQSSPSVAMDPSGNFVVVWESSGQDGSFDGIYAQRYAADGSPLGGEFRVNTYTYLHQQNPSVGMDAGGNFVVVWQGRGTGDSEGIYAHRFAADGSPLGGEFRVNTYTDNYQIFPSVAMDAAGNFVVAWQSDWQDGSYSGIYAQRYGADGSPLGGEFRVNTYTNNYQEYPSMAMDPSGNLVVAWQSSGQDGSYYGIYAQRYGADGSPLGSEFRLNGYINGNQERPAIAMDDNGNYIACWGGKGNGDDAGVYARMGKLLPTPVMTSASAVNQNALQPYFVTLNRADTAVDTAFLFYKVFTDSIFQKVSFNVLNDSLLQASIPSFPWGTTLQYYVVSHNPFGTDTLAVDEEGNPFIYSVTPELNTVTVTGRVLLEGENNHAGVKVLFEPQSPAARRDSVFSDSLGIYLIKNLRQGNYNIRYSKPGFLPYAFGTMNLDEGNYLPEIALPAGNIHYVSGALSGRLTGGDYYYITGPIQVNSGDSLLIEAGARLIFLGDYDFKVSGYLSAAGAPGDSVYFLSGQPNPQAGDWGKIVFDHSQSGGSFRYCRIDGFSGFELNQWVQGDLVFQSCHISNKLNDGEATFQFNSSSPNLEMRNTVLQDLFAFDKFYGNALIDSCKMGRFKYSRNLTIKNSHIGGPNDRATFQSCQNILIQDSRIESKRTLLYYVNDASLQNCQLLSIESYIIGYDCNNIDIDRSILISGYTTIDGASDISISESVLASKGSIVSSNCQGEINLENCTLFKISGSAPYAIDASGALTRLKVKNCIISRYDTGINFAVPASYEIAYNNFSDCGTVAGGSHIPTALGDFSLINPNTLLPVDTYYNMAQPEPFLSTNPDDSTFLHLTAASPSIDAGNPDSLDADGTIADLGAYYFDQTAWVPGFPRTENLPDGRLKLRWQTPLADTLQQYQIAYRVLGHALYQDTLFTADTTLIPDGLVDNTTYQFQLRSVFPNSLSRPTWAVGTPGTAVANLAQSIWNFELAAGENVVDSLVVNNPGSRTLNLTLINLPPEIEFLSAVTSVGPGQTAAFPFRYTAPGVNNQYTYVFGLITEQTTSIDTLSLLVNANVGYSNQGVLSHFTPVDSTGLPYTVILSNAELDGSALEIGDEIGLFDGDLCVGARVFNGIFNFSLTAWRKDDGMGLPGFTPGHPIEVRVWDRSRSIEAEMDETFQVGDGTFGYGQYSVLAVSGSVYRPQRINLANNMFELISFNRLPKNPAAPAIFDSIPGLKIVYDSDGRIYIPEYHLNSIGNIDILKGYYLYFAADSSFELAVPGISLDPQNFSYTIRAHRFNNISYLPEDTMGVVSAFGAIMDSIAIIQDSKGRSFIPEYPNAATLTYLEPGRGYQLALKSQSDVSFTYPAVSGQMEKEFVPVVMAPPEHFIAESSGKPYSIIVRSVTVGGEKLEAGDEIGVFDGELLVGGARYTGNLPLTVTAWESDSLLRIPGFRAGNPIRFKIYKHRLGVETDAGVRFARGNQQRFKGDFYSVADISVEKLVPLQFQLHQNYPNPFNPETRIRFDLPTEERVQLEIYNVLGQRVKTLVSGRVSAGYHEVVWNGRNQLGRPVGSGIYVYRIQAGDHHAVKKMVFLK